MPVVMDSPVSVVYEDFEKLIYQTVYKWMRGHGGDFEELVSEANLVFVKASRAFDPERGAFTSLLVRCLLNRFVDLYLNERYRKEKYPVSIDALDRDGFRTIEPVDHAIPKFKLEEFVEGMSEEARRVVQWALKPTARITQVAEAKGDHGRNWSKSIRMHLKDLGWSTMEIRNTFEEIAEALG